tara:strand:+ start:30 stop:791 length:762 start_codon:yes stop_codon:yes gene_type:complete
VLNLRTWAKGSGPRVTLGYTYFQDPQCLERQLELWKDYPSFVDIFLVDDGSEIHKALDVILDYGWDLPDYGPTFQLWRCTRNLGFNSHGCRNLIAKYALSDYIAFFDIDMQLSTETVGRLIVKKYSERSFYRHDLWIKHIQELKPYPGHMNSFLIHKDLFWEAGGYDESFTGHHHGDREFIERILELPNVVDRHSGQVVLLNRLGRHGSVTKNVTKTEYISEDYFYAPLPIPEVEKLRGTKKQRLDFPFIKLL